MPTQGVMNRQRVGEALIAAARTHAQKVGERLQTRFAAVLDDGAPLPDLTEYQLRLAGVVEKHLALLVVGPTAETLQTRLHELTAARRDVEVERRQAGRVASAASGKEG